MGLRQNPFGIQLRARKMWVKTRPLVGPVVHPSYVAAFLRLRFSLRVDLVDLDFDFVAEGVGIQLVFGVGVDVGFFGLEHKAGAGAGVGAFALAIGFGVGFNSATGAAASGVGHDRADFSDATGA